MSVAASVKVVDLYPDRSDGHDVSDWLKHDAVGAKLFEAIKAAPEWQPGDDKPIAAATPEDEALLVELAALSPLDYAKRRKRAATKLGISVSDLDRFVADARATRRRSTRWRCFMTIGRSLPWDEAVDGKILFRALSECVRRYVILTEPQATAVTLWVVYSWLHEHERFATHSPILLVRSAEKDSGKTTLLGIITFLTRRALNSVEISGAALFRSIAKWQPTFVIDEGDDVLTDNADLRSVLNSGWTRGQTVIRCHHDTHEPESFSTFAPKVLGMKGDKLPDTTLSRSLAIDMKPKLAGEWIADFDHLDNETFARLRRQVLRWATDNAEALAARQPEIPQDFHNRRRANWRPLLAIAEAMDVKQAGWEAALEIERRQIAVDPSTGIQLLTGDPLHLRRDEGRPAGHRAGGQGPDHHRPARAGTDRHSGQPLGHLWPERQADHRRPGHPAAQALRHQVGERADPERRPKRPTRAICGLGSRTRSRAISRPWPRPKVRPIFLRPGIRLLNPEHPEQR